MNTAPALLRYFAVSPPGAAELTLRELKGLGARTAHIERSGVSFEGDQELLYRANLWLRTASRVLVPLRSFSAKSIVMLYDQVRRMRWEDHLDLNRTFAIDAVLVGQPPAFSHSQFAALKIKDAICDRLRELWGERPNVDTRGPDVRLHALFTEDGKCTLSLDSSGLSLHARGYKRHTFEAPLKENLAAALVLGSDWDARKPFIDPMCGSGTIAIEAALLASRTAPGLSRAKFGFQGWKNYDPQLWNRLIDQARNARKAPAGKIIASDISARTLEIARAHAEGAGVAEWIDFKTADFFREPAHFDAGSHLVFNPPYGERIGPHSRRSSSVPAPRFKTADSNPERDFYRAIGDRLKHGAKGCEAWVLTGNLEEAKFIGLKPSRKLKLFNGTIECRLLQFKIHAATAE